MQRCKDRLRIICAFPPFHLFFFVLFRWASCLRGSAVCPRAEASWSQFKFLPHNMFLKANVNTNRSNTSVSAVLMKRATRWTQGRAFRLLTNTSCISSPKEFCTTSQQNLSLSASRTQHYNSHTIHVSYACLSTGLKANQFLLAVFILPGLLRKQPDLSLRIVLD
jgi:hypothetical protein